MAGFADGESEKRNVREVIGDLINVQFSIPIRPDEN
jgi:hypothetical protein